MDTTVNLQQDRARARAANSSRRKKRRRKNRTLHFVLLVLFLLAAGAVLSLSVFFKTQAVRVTGVDKYDPDEIALASGILVGENLLRLPAGEVEQRLLEAFPYIETVRIRRRLPGTAEIVIKQAQPQGAINDGDDVLLISREGKVLERGALLIPEEVPIVRGIDATALQPGDYIAEEQQEKLTMLQYLLDAMEESGFEDITNVDLTDRLNIRIVYENRIVLKLGSEVELAYKLQMVKSILENDIEPGVQGTLNAADAHTDKRRTVFSPNEGVEEFYESLEAMKNEDKPYDFGILEEADLDDMAAAGEQDEELADKS